MLGEALIAPLLPAASPFLELVLLPGDPGPESLALPPGVHWCAIRETRTGALSSLSSTVKPWRDRSTLFTARPYSWAMNTR